MEQILYICHRIPYPPNKGDKIRSYNILKFLTEHYQVHLAAFIDDPADAQYHDVLAKMCSSVCLMPLNPAIAKLKSVTALLNGRALSLPYYYDGAMQQWIDKALQQHGLRVALVSCSTMAQYISGERYHGLKRYIDFIDIDSDKWAQYKQYGAFPMSLVYGYEAKKLFRWEREIANQFDHSFFVSDKESSLFKKMVPEAANKISYFNNGVDSDYFSPLRSYDSPYPDSDKIILFTGSMACWTNVAAVVWFAREVFPAVCENVAGVKFYIVGSNPSKKVRELAGLENIVVTGAVEDIRPYFSHATVAVAPMLLARGVQNKVLEAMAMGLPTVSTYRGYEGIDAIPGEELIVIDDVTDWIETISNLLLAGGPTAMGEMARARVVADYNWQNSLDQLKLQIN